MVSENERVDWAYRAEMLKALGHPIRLQIIAILSEREVSVGELATEMHTAQATISQQLAILRMRGLVSNIRVAGRAVYSLEEERLREIIKCVRGCQSQAGARAEVRPKAAV